MNNRVYNALMRKQASSVVDTLRSIPVSLIPYVGSAAAGVGHSIGQVEGMSHDKDKLIEKLQEFEKHTGRAYAPGVGAYRLAARKAMLNKLLENKKDDERATGTSRLVMDNVSMLNPLNIIAAPAAALAAAITKTKTLGEAAKTANDHNYGLKSMLIPGWNQYQQWKAIGASDKVSDLEFDEEELKALDPETRKALEAALKKKQAKKNTQDK